MDLNGREIAIARLHTTLHIIDVGQLGPAIDTAEWKKKGLTKMVKSEDGVYLHGKTAKSKPFEAWIPNGNIASLVFMPAEAVPAAVPYVKSK